jgi:hypothetical protein
MASLTIQVDPRTENMLREISRSEGSDMVRVAERLLARAARAARPRRVFDTEAIKAANAPFAEEDELLAEAGSGERADLLAREDEA